MIGAFAMRATRPRAPLDRSLVWLLWLALLVPTAQYAATWHGLSHAVLGPSGQQDGQQAPHEIPCGLCFAASAVNGGGLPGAAQLVPHPAARHELPPATVRGIRPALPTPAYRSRAPPFAPH
jgi:hypothetical protein